MEPDERPRSVTGEAHRGVLPAGTPSERGGVRGRRRPSAVHGSPDGDAHRHGGIPQAEWASVMEDVNSSPTRFQVPPRQAELDATAGVESAVALPGQR